MRQRLHILKRFHRHDIGNDDRLWQWPSGRWPMASVIQAQSSICSGVSFLMVTKNENAIDRHFGARIRMLTAFGHFLER
jgi:hypothetical protein